MFTLLMTIELLPVAKAPEPPAGVAEVQVVPSDVNTLPVVPGATNLTALEPLPRMTLLLVNEPMPVPPTPTSTVPLLMFDPFRAERLAPDPINPVFAVIVVPVIAAADVFPITVPLITPPVIATLLAFCSAIVPKPVIAELGIVVLAVTGLELLPYRKPVNWLITTFAEAVKVLAADRVVNAPVFAVTPPIVGGAFR
jgi:hypothetical protein